MAVTPEMDLRGYIASRVTIAEDGCWIWNLAKKPSGYGLVGLNPDRRPARLAHKVAYLAFLGEYDSGLQLDHLCGVTSCVNPWHLEPVTARENNARSSRTVTSINSAKTHCSRGHEYTEDNTYSRKDRPGNRDCRKCLRIRSNSYKKEVIS